MKLYKEASLMMLPTSVKDGKLYSIFPQPKVISGELVTNGEFDEDASWQKGTGWDITGGKAVFSGIAFASLLPESSFLTIGKTYKLSLTAVVTNGSFKVQHPSSDDLIEESESGSYIVTFVATSNTFSIARASVGQQNDFSIDNISVVEVDQAPADFDFSRGADRATRVTEQGLVQPVEIVGSELVNNGSFDTTLGSELVQNGDFEEIGSELVTNGDFSNGGNGWTPQAGNFEVIQGKAVVSHTNSTSFIVQSNVAQAGKIYRVEFTISDYSEGRIRLRKPFINGELENNPRNGTFVYYGEAIDQAFELQSRFAEDANYKVDNISVKEVGQNWTLRGGCSYTEKGIRIQHTPEAGVLDTSYAPLTVGKNYRMTYEITENNGGGIKLNSATVNTLVSTVGIHTKEFISNQGTLSIARTDPSGNDVTIDNISVKEVQGLDDWQFFGNASFNNGAISYVDDGTNTNSYILQQNILTANKVYKVSFDVTRYSSGLITIEAGTNSVNVDISSGVSSYQAYVTANNTYFVIKRNGSSPNFDFDIDNISIVEVTEATDLPRLDWSGDCPVLLLEPQRTNEVTHSEDLSEYSNSNTICTPNYSLSPEGLNNSTKVRFVSSSTNSLGQNISVSSGETFTQSVFVKYIDTQFVQLFFGSSGFSGGHANFDLINKQTSAFSGATSNIEDFGNNWYRISVTKEASSAGANTRAFALVAVDSLTSSRFNDEIDGSVEVWGAQMEQGSYATSYIPTRGQAATRAKDTASIDLISKGITTGLTSATLLIEYEKPYSGDNLDVFRMQGTSDNGRAYIYETGNGFAADWNISGGGHTLGENTKVIWRLDSLSSGTMFKNGVKVNSGSGTAWSDIRYIYLNNRGTGGILKIKQIVLFPKVLSDNECINLTTI